MKNVTRLFKKYNPTAIPGSPGPAGKIFRRVILAGMILSHSGLASAQQKDPGHLQAEQQTTAPADAFLASLPQLETLIDSALAHAPLIRGQQLETDKSTLSMKHSRNNWTRDIINAGGAYTYGRFNDLNIGSDAGPSQLMTTSSAQTRYSLGVSVKIPIIAFFDHYDYKKAKIEMEQTQNTKEILVREVREEVYSRYNNLLASYQTYLTLFGDFSDQEIIMQNAEKDFLGNQISVKDMSALRISFSKAKVELAKSKLDFQKSLWMLEEYVGFKIR